MKGSIVLSGLKDWASKFHPQLPLTQRESNRLLTALTSSFRNHLDEVHPKSAEDELPRKPKTTGTGAKTSQHAMHSSAVHADNHLSSVLTNLAGPGSVQPRPKIATSDQDFANAQVDLLKNPAKDPVLLLEEYQAKGKASVPIARLCLEAVTKFLEGLSADARQKEIDSISAGKRVLLWLWQSEQFKKPAFADDRAFVDLLVPLVMQEGFERFLWDWIQMDQVLAGEASSKQDLRGLRLQYHRYRWKGRILRAMVTFRLETPGRQLQSADTALELHDKACQLKANAESHTHMSYLPLGHATSALLRTFTHYHVNQFPRTNPVLYEKFVDNIQYSQDNRFYQPLRVAELWLHHPTCPTAVPSLHWWRECLTSEDLRWKRFRESAPSSKDSAADRGRRSWMVKTIAGLLHESHVDDAAWLKDEFRRMFSEDYLEVEVRNRLRELEGITGRTQRKTETSVESAEFPLFSYSPGA